MAAASQEVFTAQFLALPTLCIEMVPGVCTGTQQLAQNTMFTDRLANWTTPQQPTPRSWLVVAAVMGVVQGTCFLLMRLFEVEPQSEFSLLFQTAILILATLSTLRIVNPGATTAKKFALVSSVVIAKAVVVVFGIVLNRSYDAVLGDLLETVGVSACLALMIWNTCKPHTAKEFGSYDQLTSQNVHQKVRISMYLLLVAVGSSSALQAWQVHEDRRATDVKLLTLAGAQGILSQRVSHIAGLSQDKNALTSLSAAIQSLKAKSGELQVMLAAELDKIRATDDADSIPPFESHFRNWQTQTNALVTTSEELLRVGASAQSANFGPASLNLKAQADTSLRASQGLLSHLKEFIQSRTNNVIMSWSVGNVILLFLLALGVVEPVVRLLQHQHKRLAKQAHELERLALVAERTNNAVIIANAQGKITWANEAFARITGFSLQEAVDQPVQNILRHDRADISQAVAIKKALDTGSHLREEMLVHTNGGQDRWLDLDVQALYDTKNSVSGFIFVSGDITEQASHRARLTSILTALPSGVIVHSVEGRVIDCNPAAEKITGLSKEQLLQTAALGDGGLNLIREDGSILPPAERPVLETLRTGQPVAGLTCGLIMPEGPTRWLMIKTEVMRSSRGDVTGVVSCMVDVTERRAQQDLLALAVEGEGVGTWQADLSTGEMTCNDRFFQMLGCDRTDLPSNLQAWSQRIHSEDLKLWQEKLHAHLLQPSLPFRCELRVQCHGDQWAWLMVSGTTLDRNDDGSSRKIAGVNVDITEQKGLRTLLSNSERTDTLTGLPNRRAALELVENCLTRASADPDYQFAVLHIDIDRFKQINDTLGHGIGDSLLRLIASRLKSILRPGDAVSRSLDDMQNAARIGGDEFVVVLEGIRHSDAAASVAQRLLETLAKLYVIDGNTIHSSASIGIVTRKDAGPNAETILRDAGIAMHEAKRGGRARFVIFEPGMHNRVAARASVETDLRKAITQHELFVVYQPVLEMSSGVTTGVEALVRWKHPTRGLVPPVEFIPVAEETGLIGALGDYVLETACTQFMEWQRSLPGRAPATLSVNLSRAQLALPGLVEGISMTLATSGMSPSQLQLEITESLAAQDEAVQAQLRELKALGVTLALDDFGTGYSSLACLHLMPVDTVKIDRSFVSPSESSNHHRVLIEATIRVAQSLGMGTVAEGIEEPGQADLLRLLQCDKGQGYLFSKPLTSDDLLLWLSARPLLGSVINQGAPA